MFQQLSFMTSTTSLILAVAIAVAPSHAQAQVDALSPEQEAATLWSQGQETFLQRKYMDTIPLLGRLIDRHPSSPHFTDALLLLGRAHLAVDQPKQALTPLKSHVSRREKTIEGVLGRLELADAYIRLKRPDEAILIAAEAKAHARRLGQAHLAASADVWKSQAQLLLGRDSQAERSVAAARKAGLKGARDLAHAAWVEVRIQTRACARLAEKTARLTENQAENQLNRRGDCLLESLLAFRKVLDQQDDPDAARWGDLAYSDVETGYSEFKAAAKNPPPPPGKRTQAQLKRYRAELVAHLEQTLDKKTGQATEIIEPWKEKLPKSAIPYITRLAKHLEELKAAP